MSNVCGGAVERGTTDYDIGQFEGDTAYNYSRIPIRNRHSRRSSKSNALTSFVPLLVGLLRQSVFGRLAGYEDVNDADRLALDPVMRQVVGGRAMDGRLRRH